MLGERVCHCAEFFCGFVIAEKIFCDGTVEALSTAGGVWTSISHVRAGEEVGVDRDSTTLPKDSSRRPTHTSGEGCHAEGRRWGRPLLWVAVFATLCTLNRDIYDKGISRKKGVSETE